jgi:hypothetical protein
MEQLSFTFPPTTSLFKIKLYKDNIRIAESTPDVKASAYYKRRALAEVLRRSPISDIDWEEEPRATGWYGLKVRNTSTPNPAHIFHLTVELDSGVTNDE